MKDKIHFHIAYPEIGYIRKEYYTFLQQISSQNEGGVNSRKKKTRLRIWLFQCHRQQRKRLCLEIVNPFFRDTNWEAIEYGNQLLSNTLLPEKITGDNNDDDDESNQSLPTAEISNIGITKKHQFFQRITWKREQGVFGSHNNEWHVLFIYDFECYSMDATISTVAFLLSFQQDSADTTKNLFTDLSNINKFLECLVHEYAPSLWGFKHHIQSTNEMNCTSCFCIHLPTALSEASPKFEYMWVELLVAIMDYLSCIFLHSMTLIAHNGGRYDLVLFAPLLMTRLSYIVKTDDLHLPRPMKYIQANGKMLGLDFDIRKMSVRFRDSILYAPTGDKSLRGCAKELCLSISKMDMNYLLIDQYLLWKAHENNGDIVNTDQKYFPYFIEQNLCDRLHHEHKETCPSILCTLVCLTSFIEKPLIWFETEFPLIYQDILEKEQESIDNHLPPLTSENIVDCLEICIMRYCMQDVKVLQAILNYLVQEIFAPNLMFIKSSPAPIFKIHSISGIMYKELVYRALHPVNETLQPALLYANQGELDLFLRESIIGGRCSSPIIGEYEYSLAWSINDLKNIHEIQEEWIKLFKQNNLTDFNSFRSYVVNTLGEEYIRLIQNSSIPLDLLLKCVVHIDICSMYPSALNAPIPDGRPRMITEVEMMQLNQLLLSAHKKQKRWLLYDILKHRPHHGPNHEPPLNPLTMQPFWAKVRCTYPKSLYNLGYYQCDQHWRILYPGLPYRGRAGDGNSIPHFKNRKYECDHSSASHVHDTCGASKLIWACGKNLYSILSSIDICELIRNGWKIEIHGEYLTKFPHIRYGFVYDQGWNENTTSSFYEGMYKIKSDGEKEKNLGKRACGKIGMNSSYGFTLNDQRIMKEFSIVPYDDFWVKKDKKIAHSMGLPPLKKQHTWFYAYEDGTSWEPDHTHVNNETNYILMAEDNKEKPIGVVKNTKLSHIGCLCLSYSRVMFQQMLQMSASHHSPHCGEGHFYVDTDSSDPTLLNVLYMDESYLGKTNLGKMDINRFQFDFGIALECTSGQKECKFWTNHGISNMPCLRQLRVLGKKCYFEFCMGCGGKTVKSKGQDKRSRLIAEQLDLQKLTLIQSYLHTKGEEDWRRRLNKLYFDKSMFVPSECKTLKEWQDSIVYEDMLALNKHHTLKSMEIPDCLLTDHCSWLFMEHEALCTKSHLLNWAKHHLSSGKLASEEPISTCRRSLKVRLFSKMAHDMEFTVQDSYLKRRLMQTQDQNLLQCNKCLMWLPQYNDYALRTKTCY
jgi:hypothetical protein